MQINYFIINFKKNIKFYISFNLNNKKTKKIFLI